MIKKSISYFFSPTWYVKFYKRGNIVESVGWKKKIEMYF